MGVQTKSGRRGVGAVLRGAYGIVATACLTITLLSAAQAQFWSPSAPRRPSAPTQQQPQNNQGFNPFGGFFGQQVPQQVPQEVQRPAPPPDNSHAPSPQPHKSD